MAYTITLTQKELVADGTMAFHFAKPEGFTYQAGQYGDFTLINPPETDAEGNKRTFSLASAPFEADLKITTRLRDTAFKRVLKNLPEGSQLEFDGPFGSLTLPKDSSRTAVFLTGGIGVTLVRSMVAQATHEQSAQKMLLISSNHTTKDAVFYEEFTQLAARNPHFTFVPVMTDMSEQDWPGVRGFITLDLVQKYVENIVGPVYYLSGSGEMVGAMRRMLMAAGVDRTSIKSDLFVGYDTTDIPK